MQKTSSVAPSSTMMSPGRSGYADALDRLVDRGTQTALRREAEQIIPLLDPQPSDRILNLGCGAGFHAFELASRSGAHVDALGHDDDCIQRGRLVCRELGRGRVRFHRSNGNQIAFLAESFDKILVESGAYQHATTPGFLFEMNRILVVGALMLVVGDQAWACAGAGDLIAEGASQAFEEAGFEVLGHQCLANADGGGGRAMVLVRKVQRHSYHAWNR